MRNDLSGPDDHCLRGEEMGNRYAHPKDTPGRQNVKPFLPDRRNLKTTMLDKCPELKLLRGFFKMFSWALDQTDTCV